MRLSIDVTKDEHKRLKAVAALQGKSIKDYVLERVLPSEWTADENAALQELASLLEPRLAEAEAGNARSLSVSEIFAEEHRKLK